MTRTRPAAADEADQVVAVVSLGFAADPALRWAFPEPGRYWSAGPRFFRAFGGRAFESGTVDVVEGFLGAALWLPPGVEPDGEALAALMEECVPPDRLPQIRSVMEQMEQCHPTEPCWHLPLIAVDPLCQRQGLGSQLLAQGLARCDRDGLPAYLEATNPDNVRLYERHGFERVATLRSGDSAPVVAMLRRP